MTNEELCIALQNHEGDRQELLLELYKKNSGMIEKIIRRYGGMEELEDLRQEAFFGIARAAELWKPKGGSKFITYAIFWIRAIVGIYVKNCSGAIRIPSYKHEQIQKYNRILNSYRVQFGAEPSDRELCALLDIRPEQLEELKADIQAARIRSTSERIAGDDEELTLEDALADDTDQIGEVIDRIQHEELSTVLWSCVDGLKENQSYIIRERYVNNKLLSECGKSLGISSERARQIELDALRELRKGRCSKRLVPYLDEATAYRWSLKGIGLAKFEQYGSVQERAMMNLERLSGTSLWHGKEV